MEKYTLKQEDFQDINILIDLGKSIKENEEKLIELEIQGKKQSPEYKSTLDCIKSTLFLEANIFRNIGANPAKISAIIAHLTTASSSVVGIDKQLSAIVNGSTRDLITQRIILRLNEIMINIDKEQINQGVLCINKETKEASVISPLKMSKINIMIKNDLINTIIALLTQEISNPNNSADVISFLIKIKYYFAFVFKNLENDLINNNFESSSTAYWTSQNYAEFLEIQKELHQDLATTCSRDAFMPSVSYFLNSPRYELLKASNSGLIKLHEIIVRAAILICSPELQKQIKELNLKQLGMSKMMHEDTYGNELLASIIDKVTNDQKSVQVITFTLKRESN